jgi:hypothetical protein
MTEQKKNERPVIQYKKRSAVSSGRRRFLIHAKGDGNSAWSRRVRDIAAAHISDLGGADHLSQAQLALIQRASAMTAECERFDALLSIGQEIDLDLYSRIAGNLRRILESIGLQRVPKDATPTLREYLEQNYATDGTDK